MTSISRQGRITGILAGVFVVLSLLLLVPGKLMIGAHEVDVLHSYEIAARIAAGERQHLDYMTPLGVLSFVPLAIALKFGASIATGFALSNIMVTLALLPAIIHVSLSRMGNYALLFGVVLLILPMALVFGGDQAVVSMSMYYNRWAWAITFICVVLILRAGDKPTPVIDGIILGLGLGALALLKMTFFLCIAPIVAIACLMDRNFITLGWTLGMGVLVAVAATVYFGGVGFWIAYANDLWTVQSTDTRSYPSAEFVDVVSSPARIFSSVMLLAAIVALRTAGNMRAGLIMLLLAPSFMFITYQNWGNDPKWLVLLAMMALVWMGDLGDTPVFKSTGRTVFAMIATASFALSAPSLVTMSLSPMRNAFSDARNFMPILPIPGEEGFMIERKRSFTGTGAVPLSISPDPQADEDEQTDIVTLHGAEFETCAQAFGYLGKMRDIAKELTAAGYAGKTLLLVDVYDPLPRLGDFPANPARPPWYYGGNPGLDEVDFIVIPRCPISTPPYTTMMKHLDSLDVTYTEVGSAAHYRIFTWQK